MNLSYTVTSKRKLATLIEEGHVLGWDDPRMPTIAGLRRRGYTPTSLRNFVDAAGVAKRENIIDMSLLEHSIREDLNKTAPRVMAVLNPIKLTVFNYPDDKQKSLEGEINPEQPEQEQERSPFLSTFTSRERTLKKKQIASFLD